MWDSQLLEFFKGKSEECNLLSSVGGPDSLVARQISAYWANPLKLSEHQQTAALKSRLQIVTLTRSIFDDWINLRTEFFLYKQCDVANTRTYHRTRNSQLIKHTWPTLVAQLLVSSTSWVLITLLPISQWNSFSFKASTLIPASIRMECFIACRDGYVHPLLLFGSNTSHPAYISPRLFNFYIPTLHFGNSYYHSLRFKFLCPLCITSPHLLSLDVNWLNVERKIILCCSGSSFSEHTPRTLAPKLFLFAKQQPASNPPTHLMVGERWQKGEEKKLGEGAGGEERESNDQYPGPVPTWVIRVCRYFEHFSHLQCLWMCVYVG